MHRCRSKLGNGATSRARRKNREERAQGVDILGRAGPAVPPVLQHWLRRPCWRVRDRQLARFRRPAAFARVAIFFASAIAVLVAGPTANCRRPSRSYRCHRKPNGLAEALGSIRRGRHYHAVASLSDQGRPHAIELAAELADGGKRTDILTSLLGAFALLSARRSDDFDKWRSFRACGLDDAAPTASPKFVPSCSDESDKNSPYRPNVRA
jgi:hypothetical protein